MAETRRAPSASPSPARRAPRPRLPHPPGYATPPRVPADDTQDLRPPAPEPGLPRPVVSAPEDRTPHEPPKPPAHRAVPPPRSRTERIAQGVLLLGLALNALALLRGARLSPSDLLLGGTVFLAGVTLLLLMEAYRRTGH
jgi:hypothetical protein